MGSYLLEQGPVVRRYVLVVVIAGVPLFFLRFTNDPLNVPKLALLLLGVSIVAAIRGAEILQGASTHALSRIWLPAAALSAALIGSWVFSPYKGWSLFGEYRQFHGLLPYLVAILLGILVADAFAGRQLLLLRALAVAGGIAAGYALIQVAGLDPLRWALGKGGGQLTEAISTLGNTNFAGGFFAIILPAVASIAIVDLRRRTHFLALGAVVLVALFLTKSQGAWAAAIGGVVIAVGGVWTARYRHALGAGALIAGLMAAAVIGQVAFSMIDPESRFSSLSAVVRGWWWEASFDMALDAPITGHGPNTFAVEGVQYRPVEDALRYGNNFSDDPHSWLFSLLAGCGVLGVLAFVVIVGWIGGKLVKGPRGDPAFWGLAGCTVAYLIQSFVSIDHIGLRSTFWAVLGGLGSFVVNKEPSSKSRSKRASRTRRGQPLRAVPAVGAIALLLVGVVVWTGGFILADARVRAAIQSIQRTNFDAGREQFYRARGFRDDYEYRHLQGFWLGEVAVSREVDGRAFYDDAKEAYSFVKRFPDLLTTNDYLELLDRARFDPTAQQEAVDLLRRSVRLDPLNNLTRVELAIKLLDMGRAQEALEVITPAADLLRAHSETEIRSKVVSPTWGAVALIQVELGNEEAARAAIARAGRGGPTILAERAEKLLQRRDRADRQ